MKRAFLLSGSWLLAILLATAVEPPLPISLDQLVSRASHIFVGTGDSLTVLSETGRIVKPQPRMLELGQVAEMSVRIDEVLGPVGWQTNAAVKVRFGGGLFDVEEMRKDFVGKKLIYLTVSQGAYFAPSYPWHLTASLDARGEVEKAIKATKKTTNK